MLDKGILLGVTGSIAAYKAAELCRLLVKEGAGVQVVMTRSATEFVAPLTFHTLTGRPPVVDMFDAPRGVSPTAHIELARECDLFLVAPATARTIAKAAAGTAEDIVSALVLAADVPVVFAPAMNVQMYSHPAVQANVKRIRSWNRHFVVRPSAGELACGEIGLGRLSEPAELVAFCDWVLGGGKTDLTGREVLVSAGPTAEDIDPVRFITNRSSGKMGYAIAEAAARRGASTTLVTGPTALPEPTGCLPVRVRSAEEMAKELLNRAPGADLVVMTAAVADYRPAEKSEQKIKKGGEDRTVRLVRTTDILEQLAVDLPARSSGRKRPLVVGFAAETGGDLKRACRGKLERKDLDLVVGNDVASPGSGFGTDTNRVMILDRDGRGEQLPLLSKRELADRILDRVVGELGEG